VSSDRLEPPAGARQSTGGGSALPPPSQTLPPDAASGARPPARSDVGLARPAPPVVAQPASPAAGGAQATVAASGFPRAVQTAALPPEAQSRVAPVLVQTSVQPTSLWVQVGAFSNYDNALRLSSRLRQFGATQIASVDAGAQRLYRVRIGPMQRVPDADQLLAQVANVAPEARIVVD
jgi:rare lipoprotein A